MARKKEEQNDNINKFAQELDDFISESCGVQVEKISERESIPYWINSGCYSLNWIIANDFFKGVPGTKAILLEGLPSVGKSLILDVLLGNNIRIGGMSYKFDIEDAASSEFTHKIVGSREISDKIRLISPKQLKQSNPITIEKLTSALNKIVDFQISKKEEDRMKLMIGVDSVSQLTSIKEYEDVSHDKDKKDMTPQQKMRALFRVLNQKLRHANITLIGVAHLTANIGVMFGDKNVASAKGSGWLFGSSLRLRMLSAKEIIDPKAKVPIGVMMKIKTIKNRIEFKGRTAFLYMYFDSGINQFGGLPELLAQYGVVTASTKPDVNGIYKHNTKFSYTRVDENGTKEIVFTISNIEDVVKENGGEQLLKEWNQRLNDVYSNALKSQGVTEEDLLTSDDAGEEGEIVNED